MAERRKEREEKNMSLLWNHKRNEKEPITTKLNPALPVVKTDLSVRINREELVISASNLKTPRRDDKKRSKTPPQGDVENRRSLEYQNMNKKESSSGQLDNTKTRQTHANKGSTLLSTPSLISNELDGA